MRSDHLLAGLGSHGLEQWPDLLGPFGERHGPQDRLHIGDAGDSLGMPPRPGQPQRPAPIVQHQRHLPVRDHRVDPGVEIARMFCDRVTAGPAVRQLGAVAHADQVGRDQPAGPCHRRHDIAPEE